MAMPKFIQNIPKEKRLIVGLGAVALGYVAYSWYRNSREAAEAEAAAAAAGPYDEGYVTQATPGGLGYSEGTTAGQIGTDDESMLPTIRTNAEWAQYASEQLSFAGHDPVTVLNALGNYLDRRPLSSAEQQIVRAALAVAGKPPVGSFQVSPGMDTPDVSELSAPVNVRSRKSATKNTVYLKWDKVTGASGYRVYRSGASQNVGHSLDTIADIGGLNENTSYQFTVRALDNQGKTGPASAPATIRTAKESGSSTPAPSKPKKPKTPPHYVVKAKRGDTISGIAARYGKSTSAVWNFNLKYRNPATAETLRKRGKDLIYRGTRIWVPK